MPHYTKGSRFTEGSGGATRVVLWRALGATGYERGARGLRGVSMEITSLGRTGLKVSRLCLGTMTFGLQADEAAAFAIMDRANQAGINFIDTADAYPQGANPDQLGRTEEIVGDWLRERNARDRIVLATKVYNAMGPGPN